MANNIGNVLVRIGANPDGLIAGLKKSERALDRAAAKFQNVGRTLSMSITMPLIGVGAAAIKSFGDIQRLEKGLAATMGSAGAARAEMKRLQKIAEAPSLGFEQAIQGSIQLQNVGLTADQARNALEQLANTTAIGGGTVDDLSEVTRQFGQMISKGKILEAELRIIKERMPAVGQAMQDAFKTQNTAAIQEMGMTSREFMDRLIASMEKMPRVEGGVSNALENVGIAAKMALAGIGESIQRLFEVQGKLEALSKWLDGLTARWNGLSDGAQRFIIIAGLVVAAIGPILIAVGALIKAWAAVKGAIIAVSGVFGLLSLKIIVIVGGILILATIVNTVAHNWQNLKTVMADVWDAIAISARNGVGRFLKSIDKALNKMNEALGISKRFNLAEGFEEQDLPKAVEVQWVGPIEAAKRSLGQLADMMGIWRKEAQATQEEFPSTAKAISDFSIAAGDGTDATKNGDFRNELGEFGRLEKEREDPLAVYNRMREFSDKMAKHQMSQMGKVFKVAGEYVTQFGKWTEGVINELGNMPGKIGAWFRYHGEELGKWAEKAGHVFQQLGQTVQQYFAMRANNIEEDYERQRRAIESSVMDEKAKAAAIDKLDAATDVKRRRLRRQQAIADKATSLMRATLDGINAVIATFRIDPTGILASIVGALVGAQIGMIASTKIPALAKGGLAYGPQLAMVGDNRGARVDPEVIAPLSKLQDYMGGQTQRVVVEGRISGKDILLVQERALIDRNRTRGY